MSPPIGSFNRSLSYSFFPFLSSRFSFSDLTSSPLPSFFSNSPRTDSDDSTQTVFNTISTFYNSDKETPDKFLDSKHCPTNFSQPPFQLIASQLPNKTSPFPSSYTDACLSFPQYQVNNTTHLAT